MTQLLTNNNNPIFSVKDLIDFMQLKPAYSIQFIHCSLVEALPKRIFCDPVCGVNLGDSEVKNEKSLGFVSFLVDALSMVFYDLRALQSCLLLVKRNSLICIDKSLHSKGQFFGSQQLLQLEINLILVIWFPSEAAQ